MRRNSKSIASPAFTSTFCVTTQNISPKTTKVRAIHVSQHFKNCFPVGTLHENLIAKNKTRILYSVVSQKNVGKTIMFSKNISVLLVKHWFYDNRNIILYLLSWMFCRVHIQSTANVQGYRILLYMQIIEFWAELG